MALLSLSTLGPLQVALDGKPITDFKSNKVRGLLVYLAVEADRPHSRETLAGLFWPEWPDKDALSNLRYSLSNLRQVINDRVVEPPFLLISRESIQFNTASQYHLDVATFQKAVETNGANPDVYERATGLYKGEFLEGFSLDDCPAFEEWVVLTRERLARQALSMLHTLADDFEARGEYDRSQVCAWRLLELEPWDESAHQQLMRLLALTGKRSAALAQYETCRELLAGELGVQPSEETTKLYEKIRDGKLKTGNLTSEVKTDTDTRIPPFVGEEKTLDDAPVFVARERELSQLTGFLNQALAGQGKVVFVTGEAGSGKTTLIQEFTRRVQALHTDLLVAAGNCNAYTGIGDPYLPFREILELLTGDVESRWAAGAISKNHAIRLWNKLPVVTRALVDAGPDLIDTFIQRTALLERANAFTISQSDWLKRLEEFLGHKPAITLSAAALHQIDLFEQYTRVLQVLEEQSPLLLVVDDLQWADAGSVNLLFHLGRRLAGSRILIIGSYRLEEVSLGRDGSRHPLEPVVNELRREYGNITINLGQALDQIESREFVDSLLDSEPNQFGMPFRDMLYLQTQGHPLFTIELMRGLQERGDIVKDSGGCWISGASLDWETLPARVEAAIQERIGRLPGYLQKALEVASVEGEIFTAEVVARVQGVDEREMLEYLSGELDRKHRLVRARSIQRVEGRLFSRYQFRHILFQKYLYNSLDEVVRVHLHEQVGNVLEEAYGVKEDVAANAIQLARHFEEARIDEKAVHYLQLAGNKAVQLSAYQDAVTHLSRGLKILETLPESTERDHKELDSLLPLAFAIQGTLGAQAPGLDATYDRAKMLCQRIGTVQQMAQILGGLTVLYYVRAEYRQAKQCAKEALTLAQQIEDSILISLCHWYLGFISFCLGEYLTAQSHLRHVTNFYEPKRHHHAFLSLRGSDAGLGALAYDACCLWCLGFPEQAEKRSQEVLSLAREIGHPFSLADVLCFAGCLVNSMQQDGDRLMRHAQDLMELSRDRDLKGWYYTGVRSLGEAITLKGNYQEGIAVMRQGLKEMHLQDVSLNFSSTYNYLAEALAKTGCLDEGLATLEEAFSLADLTEERYWEAELCRSKGKILLMQDDEVNAESCFKQAIEIARAQNAKALELRAAMSLSRLWESQGKRGEAYQLLANVYNWFTEGFDTPDLLAAKELLEEFS